MVAKYSAASSGIEPGNNCTSVDGCILWQSYVMEQRLAWHSSWDGIELETVLPWPLPCWDYKCGPPAPDGNYWILVKICWWIQNKFSMILESSGFLAVLKDSVQICGHLVLLSYWQMDKRPSQSQTWCLWLGWLSRHLGYPCMGTCVQVCVHLYVWREWRMMRELHRTPISGHLSTTGAARTEVWSATHRMLQSSVSVSPRQYNASSEVGCGCRRASALHTAPVKTNRYDAGS